MTEKVFENNQVTLVGEVVSDFTFSHDVYGEGFYMIEVKAKRLSDSYDYIPVMVSDRLLSPEKSIEGQFVIVTGQFRSYNKHDENKNRLILSVFAREIEIADEEPEDLRPNYIYLDGYVCKPPIYRKTPLGREIADILLAVNRPYGKSDYIPCICWGRNARYADSFEIGGRVMLWGRIQSREYQKKYSETEIEKKIAYEVSVSKLEYDLEKNIEDMYAYT